jgi:plasmid stabilization system protein ParE
MESKRSSRRWRSMGEAVDYLRPGLRRWVYGQYLIFFEPRDYGIALIRVLHGARKIDDLFGQ